MARILFLVIQHILQEATRVRVLEQVVWIRVPTSPMRHPLYYRHVLRDEPDLLKALFQLDREQLEQNTSPASLYPLPVHSDVMAMLDFDDDLALFPMRTSTFLNLPHPSEASESHPLVPLHLWRLCVHPTENQRCEVEHQFYGWCATPTFTEGQKLMDAFNFFLKTVLQSKQGPSHPLQNTSSDVSSNPIQSTFSAQPEESQVVNGADTFEF